MRNQHVNHDPFTPSLPHSVGWERCFPPIQASYIATCIPRSQLESSKESTCQCRRDRRCGFHPWVREMPWRRKWQPAPVFSPGKFHGERSLGGCSHPWMTVSLVSAVTPQKHHQRLHTAGVEWSRDFSKMTQLLINILFCLVTKLWPILASPQTVALPAPVSMGFPRQEYWSGFSFPFPDDLTYPGCEPVSLALEGRFFIIEPTRETLLNMHTCK